MLEELSVVGKKEKKSRVGGCGVGWVVVLSRGVRVGFVGKVSEIWVYVWEAKKFWLEGIVLRRFKRGVWLVCVIISWGFVYLEERERKLEK